MSVASIMSNQDISNKKILSIDPATHSLAYACMSSKDNLITLHGYGKIDLKSEKNIWKKIAIIRVALPHILKKFKNIDEVIIEQSIYISNFQTSRLISYIIGATGATSDLPMMDVGPMTWKSGIGYKNVSAAEKKNWATFMTAKEVKKKAEFERKNRVKVILEERIPNFSIDDDDVTDAVALGLWRLEHESL